MEAKPSFDWTRDLETDNKTNKHDVLRHGVHIYMLPFHCAVFVPFFPLLARSDLISTSHADEHYMLPLRAGIRSYLQPRRCPAYLPTCNSGEPTGWQRIMGTALARVARAPTTSATRSPATKSSAVQLPQ